MVGEMEKIKKFLKQFFCKHAEVNLLRWYWTHGPNGNDPLFIEAEYRCKECGKIIYVYRRGKDADEWARAMGNHKKA